jgi:hypothetical protein
MAIKQRNIGSHVVTYDDETNALLSFEANDDYKKRKEEATLEILSKKDEFKQRGSIVVKKEFIDNWANLVDNSLSDLEQVWYNGASIEAALQCMEKLSQGFPIDEAYKHIDIQNPDLPCVYFGMGLSGWQNNSITSVVGSYHERGQEFCNYRNNFVNNQQSFCSKKR